jgi:hypothetical protein
LGNLRTTFKNQNNLAQATQMADYDVFGWDFNKLAQPNSNLNKYQKQLRVEDFGLNIDFFKYRPSDSQIGRFWMVDPLADSYPHNSVYALQENKFGLGVELEGRELSEFLSGFKNAIIEDTVPLTPSANRRFESNSYEFGKTAGHYGSIAIGLLEIGNGLQAAGGSAAVAVESGGILTIPAVAGAALGLAEAALGVNTVKNAVTNLNSSGNNPGRGKNHLQPDKTAQGDHSTFRTDPKSGKTTNTATYKENARNPKTGFTETKRVDVTGKAHVNSKTKELIKTPHVIEPKQKNPRPARQDELPRQ